MMGREATLAEEQLLLDTLARYEPVQVTLRCDRRCGRQVAHPGPCLRCRHQSLVAPTPSMKQNQENAHA